jgi:PAS domain-containing protein
VERQKSLVLIRAKHLAESVTTPMFLADDQGNLIFYNEAAESLLGRPFVDNGALSPTEWQRAFDVRDRNGEPFPLESMASWIEVQNEQPAMGHLQFRSADGTDHLVATCAFPLFTEQQRFEGALILFWRDG